MKLAYLADAAELDNFLIKTARKNGAEFLQSWTWGEIVRAEGQAIIRLGARDDASGSPLRAVATLIKTPLFGGYFYYYTPRGPIGDNEAAAFLLSEFIKIEPQALFCRFEPEIKAEFNRRIYQTLSLQPAKTLFLDLSQSEEELLARMHQKTRYNIRLAEKKGVIIIEGGSDGISEWERLARLTGERDGFRLHETAHYANLLRAGEGKIKLYFARYDGKNVAAALFSYFGSRATYLHGASDNVARALMAPYLLQWSAIRAAKKAGFAYYDFYGIDVRKWPGVTRFKQGFGGRVVDYPGTFDLVYRPFIYNLYLLARQIRRFASRRPRRSSRLERGTNRLV